MSYDDQGARVSSKRKPRPDGRIPVPITLSAEDYEFICSCIRTSDARSVDQLIAAALAAFREHLLAFIDQHADEPLRTSELKCSVTYHWTV